MEIKYQWAIKHNRTGEIVVGTVNDSADAAIAVVLKRINADSYEALEKIDFKLVRVRVTIETISEI